MLKVAKAGNKVFHKITVYLTISSTGQNIK